MGAPDQHHNDRSDADQRNWSWDEWRTIMARARRSRHLSILDLCRMVGVSRQALSNWENGVHRPNIINAARWAAALDRTVPDAVQILLRTRDTWKPGADATCGTDAGYIRHQRLRETPCGPCREAHREYQRRWRARRRAKLAEQQDTA